MANQKPGAGPERKDPGSQPAKEAPGRVADPDSDDPARNAPATEPQDPGDLGRDPKPDNIQTRG